MMVGALVLASCVKNQESQSVTDVRNARADEIKSQAELNRANAEAAVMLAKAQAAIAAAQAELLEAQQAIVEAEAAKMRAEAELAAVEVEIAKVKLEGERVKLQAQKAELEALIAKYEADIAKYAVKKEKALNELAKAEMQAEIDEITMQKKLIDEQTALMKAAAAFGIEKELEVNALWALYSDAVVKLNKAQTDYIHKQVQLAMLEAGEDTAMDILADKIAEKQIEVETQELLIAELESRVDVNAATIKSAMETAKAALENALTEEARLTEESNLLAEELQRRELQPLEYEQDWRNNLLGGDPNSRLISWFENLAEDFVITDPETGNKNHVFVKDVVRNPDTGRDEAGIYFFYQSADPENKIKHNVFIPLYTADGDHYQKIVEDYVYNPTEDGVIDTKAPLTEVTYVPAWIYTENFKDLIELMGIIETAEHEQAIDKAEEDYEEMVAYIQARMEALEAELAQRQEYVTAASEEVTAAFIAVRDAETAAEEAEVAWDVAAQNYMEYAGKETVSDKAKAEARALNNVMSAFDMLKAAQERVEKLHVEIFGVANADVATPSSDDEVVIGLLSKVKALENAAFESGKVAAEKELATKKAKEACDDHKDLETAWKDAQTKLETEEGKIPAAKKEEQVKLEAYHYAVLVYTADPTAVHKDEMDAAETAYKKAKDAADKIVAAIPELEAAVTKAYDAWNVYYGPFKEAETAETLAKKAAKADYDAWQKAKAALGSYDDPVTAETAFGRFNAAVAALGEPEDDSSKETAYGLYNKCVDALEAAIEAAGEDSDATLLELRVAWHDATDAYREARFAIRVAEREIALLIEAPDAKYPDFIENLAHIYPIEGESFFKDVYEFVLTPYLGTTNPAYADGVYMPGQNYAQYVWYGEKLEEVEEKYMAQISGAIDDILEKYLTLNAEVARFEEAKEDYLAYIEGMQELAEAILENQIEVRDANIEEIAPFVAYNALKKLYAAKVYRVDGAGEPYVDIEAFEKVIEDAKKELVKMQAELADLMSQLIAGIEVTIPGQTPEYLNVMINKLENEIAALEVEIDMLAAKIQGYLEALDQLLTTVE